MGEVYEVPDVDEVPDVFDVCEVSEVCVIFCEIWELKNDRR